MFIRLTPIAWTRWHARKSQPSITLTQVPGTQPALCRDPTSKVTQSSHTHAFVMACFPVSIGFRARQRAPGHWAGETIPMMCGGGMHFITEGPGEVRWNVGFGLHLSPQFGYFEPFWVSKECGKREGNGILKRSHATRTIMLNNPAGLLKGISGEQLVDSCVSHSFTSVSTRVNYSYCLNFHSSHDLERNI